MARMGSECDRDDLRGEIGRAREAKRIMHQVRKRAPSPGWTRPWRPATGRQARPSAMRSGRHVRDAGKRPLGPNQRELPRRVTDASARSRMDVDK